MSLSAGDTVLVRLDENETTGYRWEYVPVSPEIMQLVAERHVPPSGGGGVGAAGSVQFEFAAGGTGSAPVVLQYRRAWEPQAVRRYEIFVTIT